MEENNLQPLINSNMKGQQTITDDAKSSLEVKTEIALAASALASLKPFWNDRNITMTARLSLLRKRVTTIFLYVKQGH